MFVILACQLWNFWELTKHQQACVFDTFRPTGSPRTRLGVTSGPLRGHLARENSARGHFEATWLEKTRPGVTSRPLGTRKLDSGSLRGHLAREDSARDHIQATWLKEARLGVTSRTLGSGKLGSGLLRGHLARESSARVLSRPLDSLGLPWLCLARFGFAQFCSAGSS